MKRVLMISKPVLPPWDDSTGNLVKDLARNGRDWIYHLMGTRTGKPPVENSVWETVYDDLGSYTPGKLQNLKVLARLFRPDSVDIYHFFFAPNPLTSKAARLIRMLKPGKRLIHTICSRPADFRSIGKLMFAHEVVALSNHTKERLLEAGVDNVSMIPPAIDAKSRVSENDKLALRRELGLPLDKPLVLFAGDYQFNNASMTVAKASGEIVEKTGAHIVFACRIKQEASRAIEQEVKQVIADAGLTSSVSFFNAVDRMERLVATASLQVLPADNLYAKMDIPLVLLESLREEVPIIVSDAAPVNELLARPVGLAVPPGDPDALAKKTIELLLDEPRRRSMGLEGRKMVIEHNDASVVARQYEALYEKCKKRKNP